MKVCVYFQPKESKDNFEGARLRENIKGSLKSNNIAYASNVVDEYDVIHFLSIDDLLKINDATESNIPTFISALNCESDDSANFLTEKNGNYVLSPKAKRVLNKVDSVIVSDETSKHLLIELGVKKRIDVISPGVDPSRFEFDDDNKDIFYQYYQIEKSKKIVAIIGTYDDKNTPKKLMHIANMCPNYDFFYFGNARALKLFHENTKMPANVRLCQITNNEIYCSMMANASIYLALDNSKHSPITLLDAMASKTQIVALSPTLLNEELLKLGHAYIGKDEDEVASYINKLYNGELKDNSEVAYQYACENSLKNVGKKLLKIYQRELDRRKEND